MNKYKIYMIISIIILIISIGTSLAWYVWSSTNNALVNLDVCTPTISFAGGSTINGIDIVPVLNKEDGTIKDIEVKKSSNCTKDVTMNLYLELTTLPTELADSSFVYELYKNNTKVSNGNFSGKIEGSTITILPNEVLNTSKDLYTLYIYIDGTKDNPIEMAGKNFLFKLWGSGEGAIYKENVITPPDNPSSSTSKFFNTEVMREEINTITIAEDNTVPEEEGIISKDISSNQDGTVMLWYKPKEVTTSDGSTKTMYDMWIGGENGVVQTNTNASGMFAYLTNVESLDLSKLDTSNITSMSKMFYKSSGLKNIDFSNFNTSNVTNMSSMFEGCSSLTSLDLSNFDTLNVISMGSMFLGCSSLITLDLSNFNTSKVTNMSSMFSGCISLTSLDIRNMNFINVTNYTNMFINVKNDCEIIANSEGKTWINSNFSKLTNVIIA